MSTTRSRAFLFDSLPIITTIYEFLIIVLIFWKSFYFMPNQESALPKNYPEPTGIKSWAEEDRPREKLLLKGKHALSESELIAILVRTGSKEKNALEISKELMRKVNNDLYKLAQLSVKDIQNFEIPSLGETKAISIVAALELGRRKQFAE